MASRLVLSSLRAGGSSSTRRCLATASDGPKVCIVGAGPAGFYAAQHLLSRGPNDLRVDLVERLPVPFGLVRFGVAPDHPEVKNVDNTFSRTVSRSGGRLRFFGNVPVGADSGGLPVSRLRRMYDAVVLSYGAAEDREMGVPGEGLRGVLSARRFVDLYNGLPDSSDSGLDLSSCGDAAAVVGAGNVALDVARILLTPVDQLRSTDITERALDQLAASRIRRVHIIGRRGPLQVAFTIKELREMVNLPKCKPHFDPADFAGVKEVIPSLKRPRKRLTELLARTALDPPTDKQLALREGGDRGWTLKLLRTPEEVVGDGGGAVSGIRLRVNRLVGDKLSEHQKVDPTDVTETLECGLVLRSIGYKSVGLESESVPFDKERGVIPNQGGRVETPKDQDEGVGRLYCAGWVATGPRGVIVDTMTAAFAAADAVLEDLAAAATSPAAGSRETLEEALEGREVVDWPGWGRIDAREVAAGAAAGKPREKMTASADLLIAAK